MNKRDNELYSVPVPLSATEFKDMVPFFIEGFETAGMPHRHYKLDIQWAIDRFLFDYYCDDSTHIYSIKKDNTVDCVGSFTIIKSRYSNTMESVERICFVRNELPIRTRVKLCSEMIDFMEKESKRLGAIIFRMGVWPGNGMPKLLTKKGYELTELYCAKRLD